MTPPFASSLTPGAARRQAALLLILFYAVIYGTAFLAGPARERLASPLLSALLIGSVMLLAVLLLVRRDGSWRESLGLVPQPPGGVVAWSLLGFVGTYAVNLVLTTLYISAAGSLEALAARRASWVGALAQLPGRTILPLVIFVGLWEELVFRGFLLGRLRAALPAPEGRERRRDAAAVVLTALFFGAGHGYQGPLGLMQTSVAGVVLGTLAVRRGSLWPAIGTHLAIDLFGLVLIRLIGRALT
jgi:membrane protease YdiL (CAAX protease family)